MEDCSAYKDALVSILQVAAEIKGLILSAPTIQSLRIFGAAGTTTAARVSLPSKALWDANCFLLYFSEPSRIKKASTHEKSLDVIKTVGGKGILYNSWQVTREIIIRVLYTTEFDNIFRAFKHRFA
jgi:hypothetical protein